MPDPIYRDRVTYRVGEPISVPLDPDLYQVNAAADSPVFYQVNAAASPTPEYYQVTAP